MSAINMESLTFKDFFSKGQFEVYKSTLPADHLARAAVEIMQRGGGPRQMAAGPQGGLWRGRRSAQTPPRHQWL